jgi:hypothetical protein
LIQKGGNTLYEIVKISPLFADDLQNVVTLIATIIKDLQELL